MRMFSLLVVALVLGCGVSAAAQEKHSDKKPAPKSECVLLWQEHETRWAKVLKSRTDLAKAIADLKATRKKAETATYKALCEEVSVTAKKQREAVGHAQNVLNEAEKVSLQTLMETHRKLPAAVEKDTASGVFDKAPALKEEMLKRLKDGRGMDALPKKTIDGLIDQIHKLALLRSVKAHDDLSKKEAKCGKALAVTRKEGAENKEMKEARKAYLQYLDEAITATEDLAKTPFVSKAAAPKVSPK